MSTRPGTIDKVDRQPDPIAGARRVLAQRGGLVAFDVGVSKTYAALAVLVCARQDGRVRRPVILKPAAPPSKTDEDEGG